MEPLSSIDASFILTESPERPMHISSVSIYNPATAPRQAGVPVRFKQILQRFEDAIYEVPMLRRRLVKIPGNLDFPLWIEDPDFDIEFHVRHIALPRPGDWRQFFIQLARLHSRPLDMSRPLWEIYVIEGLNHLDGIPPGSFAIVQKLHHAAVDGAAAKKMFMALNDDRPDAHRPPQRGRPLLREQRPGSLSLLLRGSQRSLGRPLRLGSAALRIAQSLRRVSAAEARGEIGPEIEPPVTRFNQPASPHRVVTAATFELAEFTRLRRALPGATVNDVALSVCGGALRRYLAAKQEPLDVPLVAQVPVDIRSRAEQLQGGNVISTINASCGSDIADPLERLEAVRLSTTEGKKRLEAMGESLNHEVAEALGPHVTRAVFSLLYDSSTPGFLGDLLPNPANFVFSNMPGPLDPVYFCGAELVWGTGLGPLMPSTGLFVAVGSLRDKMIYSVTACRNMMPDPEFFQQCIYASYEETRSAATGDQKKGKKTGVKRGR